MKTVLFKVAATIALNRPESLNSLNVQMGEELALVV